MFGQHDSYLLVALPTGQVERGAALLGAGLHGGRAGEEELSQLHVALLCGQGEGTLPGVGEGSAGVAAIVQQQLHHVNVVLTAGLEGGKGGSGREERGRREGGKERGREGRREGGREGEREGGKGRGREGRRGEGEKGKEEREK